MNLNGIGNPKLIPSLEALTLTSPPLKYMVSQENNHPPPRTCHIYDERMRRILPAGRVHTTEVVEWNS